MDPKIFEDLQNRIDEDADVRDKIKTILQGLERQGRHVQSILSRAHSTKAADLKTVIEPAEEAIKSQIDGIQELSKVAANYPFYKFNMMWTREVQNVIFAILFCGWLGGVDMQDSPAEQGKLLTVEQVGQNMKVPVNLKNEDNFHITIEEYLQALISLIEELSRLAVSSVINGDYSRPLEISKFIKDLHAGFQLLNLKNDSLRRRNDSIKYSMKKVEDIVYDITLRGLIPKQDDRT